MELAVVHILCNFNRWFTFFCCLGFTWMPFKNTILVSRIPSTWHVMSSLWIQNKKTNLMWGNCHTWFDARYRSDKKNQGQPWKCSAAIICGICIYSWKILILEEHFQMKTSVTCNSLLFAACLQREIFQFLKLWQTAQVKHCHSVAYLFLLWTVFLKSKGQVPFFNDEKCFQRALASMFTPTAPSQSGRLFHCHNIEALLPKYECRVTVSALILTIIYIVFFIINAVKLPIWC